MKCEKCGCEDYSVYKDHETGEWRKECQNCGEELESNEIFISEV